MANGNGDKKALFDKLVGEGADPKEAAKFAGVKPPSEAKGTPKTTDKTTPKSTPKSTGGDVRLPKMNPTSAQKIIFGVMVGVTGLTIFGDIVSGKARAFDTIPRRMIGGSIAGILLMIFATFAPRLAVSFAVLAGAGSLFLSEGGKTTLDALTRLTGGVPLGPNVDNIDRNTGAGGGATPI